MSDELFNQIKIHIEMELQKSIEPIINQNKLIHTHPPLRKLVDNCEYCKKYGNIFMIS